MAKQRVSSPTEESAHYDLQTRRHYQDSTVARRYDEDFRGELTLRRIPAKVIAAREVSCVSAALKSCGEGVRRILDVPCGTGKLHPLLYAYARESLVGCDISAEMLSVARGLGVKTTPKPIMFVRGDATALPYPDASFDCVVCLRLLHRVPPSVRLAVIKELARVSARYVIVSFGRETSWQKFRLWVRRITTHTESCPFPASKEEIGMLSTLGGMQARGAWSVVLLLSAEVIMLLEKPGPGIDGGSAHE